MADIGGSEDRLEQTPDVPRKLTPWTMAALIDHYRFHELAADCTDCKSFSTRSRKVHVLRRWVLPRWGNCDLRTIFPFSFSCRGTANMVSGAA